MGRTRTNASADPESSLPQAQYAQEELLLHAEELFGVKPEVLYGVFNSRTEQSFTIEEVHTQIQQFMKAKVE
ncbi:hypothetical protein AR543_08110 [Paenibacillus bovis]|uniref:YqzN/YkzM domain-containing protein n=1 Tax=Paenibacillus bovis TaxID=1616788 RepID=A0A172ZM31_9BACL|nr:hypothetical protein AR543_08110 [Paenibacillus bovis]